MIPAKFKRLQTAANLLRGAHDERVKKEEALTHTYKYTF